MMFQRRGESAWFHLYGLIHCTPEGLVSFDESTSELQTEQPVQLKNGETHYVMKLFDAVEEFIQHSALGELGVRLAMLQCFAHQINSELQSNAQMSHRIASVARRREADILSNQLLYYKQFIPHINAHIARAVAPIHRELHEHVKLQRWDAGSYWALKDASDKSQRVLLRCLKKFDELLNTRFEQILVNVEHSDAAGEPSDARVDFDVSGKELMNVRKQIEAIVAKIGCSSSCCPIQHPRLQKLSITRFHRQIST